MFLEWPKYGVYQFSGKFLKNPKIEKIKSLKPSEKLIFDHFKNFPENLYTPYFGHSKNILENTFFILKPPLKVTAISNLKTGLSAHCRVPLHEAIPEMDS